MIPRPMAIVAIGLGIGLMFAGLAGQAVEQPVSSVQVAELTIMPGPNHQWNQQPVAWIRADMAILSVRPGSFVSSGPISVFDPRGESKNASRAPARAGWPRSLSHRDSKFSAGRSYAALFAPELFVSVGFDQYPMLEVTTYIWRWGVSRETVGSHGRE